MTIITTEQAQKLLDEATPGPWRSDDAAVRLDDKSLIASVYGNGRGSFMSNNRLFAAAPDLARSLITAHEELAKVRATMSEFCRCVEAGEIRSRKTYAQFLAQQPPASGDDGRG